MGKKIRVWDGTAWQDVSPSLPYTAIHSAQASMPLTGVDGQVWLDTDGTLADTAFVPLSGGTMTGNLNTSSINSGGISGYNYLLNGGFDIWQRGASNIINQGYSGPDRWYADFAVAVMQGTMERGTFTPGQTDVPGNPKYYWRINVNNTNGSATMEPATDIEDVSTLAGETVTLSGWGRISSGTRSIGWMARQKFGTGGSDIVSTSFGDIVLTTSWQKFSFTVTLPSVNGKTIGPNSALRIYQYGYATAPTSYQIDWANIKLEKGSTATPFSRAGVTIAGELSACQRYYYRATSENATYGIFGAGLNSTTTDGIAMFTLPVTMRTTPTALDYSTIGASDLISVNSPVTSATLIGSESTKNVVRINFVSAGLTAYRPTYVRAYNSTSGYIGFSAELP